MEKARSASLRASPKVYSKCAELGALTTNQTKTSKCSAEQEDTCRNWNWCRCGREGNLCQTVERLSRESQHA